MSGSCDNRIINTGAGCAPTVEVGDKLAFMYRVKADGTRNSFDATTTLNKAFWDGLVNKAAKDERLMPLPELNLITDVAGEDLSQDVGGGKTVKVDDGMREFSASIVGDEATNVLYNELKDLECEDLAAYVIYTDGAISGVPIGGNATTFAPIRIQKSSLSVVFNKKNVATPEHQSITISFKWARIENVGDIAVITEAEMTDGVSEIEGLKSVNGVITTPTTTSFKIKLTTDFGSLLTKIPVEGMVAGDITLQQTAPTVAAVPVTSISESATEPGLYTINYAAETIGDVLVPTISIDGFEFSLVNALSTTLA